MTIVTIVGTRPEIIKMAPVIKELDKLGDHVLIDSGQHYDYNMDQLFYEAMDLRAPDYRFDLRGSMPIEHFTETMARCKDIVRGARYVVVEGDTNTALAGALTANKLKVPLAHVEAGLRSYDRAMPEEHNRVLTDHLADVLFAPSWLAVTNLKREGIRDGIEMVGNSITDALLYALPKLPKLDSESPYVVVTMHRSENMKSDRLMGVFDALGTLSRQMGVVFLAHPRTQRFVECYQVPTFGIKLQEPVGYLEMLALVKNAAVVLTDSGGLQEETCFLRVPCVTLRTTTERPETVRVGANRLALKTDDILWAVEDALSKPRAWRYPYGDGTTAKLVAAKLALNL